MAIDFMYSDIHIYIFPQSLFIHVTDFFSHLFYSVFFSLCLRYFLLSMTFVQSSKFFHKLGA